jgi:hypothetical protein
MLNAAFKPSDIGFAMYKPNDSDLVFQSEPKRMNISGVRNPITTEPNQALQRINMLVTDCAPSSTLRAKHVHR